MKIVFLKIVFQQGTTKLSVEKNKTSITSDIGMQFFDPRTQNVLFSTDYETHEFHLPSGVKSLNVQKASTERVWFIFFALLMEENYCLKLQNGRGVSLFASGMKEIPEQWNGLVLDVLLTSWCDHYQVISLYLNICKMWMKTLAFHISYWNTYSAISDNNSHFNLETLFTTSFFFFRLPAMLLVI